jgi:hypothetical protein
MSATTIMLVAIGSGIVGRWANNEDAIPSAIGVVEIVFALLVISALDAGRTQGIAVGFAWLFLSAVLLGKHSPINGIVKIANKKKG